MGVIAITRGQSVHWPAHDGYPLKMNTAVKMMGKIAFLTMNQYEDFPS
jgi:hypothetical protein